MRLAIFIGVVLLIFLPLNWLAYRQLVRIHPRRKWLVRVLLIAGNLMWPLLPLLRSGTPALRFARATLAPIGFSWICFTLLYAIVLLLILLGWLPFRRRRTFAEFARWPSRVFLCALTLASLVGFYHAIVPLRVERVPIEVANLPPSLEGTRLVLLGDLHVGLFTRPSRLEKIFTTTSALKPDAVIIAGDLLDDDPYFVPKLLDGARWLTPSTPLLAVLGNHEMYGGPQEVIRRLNGSRIRLLVNEGYALRDLWIAGISDYAGRGALAPNLSKALAAKPASSLPLVIAHQPKIIDEASRRSIPIALTAHTHGGQLGYRPLRWSLAGVFVRYHMGLYRTGPTQMYINTGTGYWLVPFRLGMTPEITLIELRNVRRAGASQ